MNVSHSLQSFLNIVSHFDHKTIKIVVAFNFFVTVEVIKSKLIIVILKKKQKGFRVRVFVHIF